MYYNGFIRMHFNFEYKYCIFNLFVVFIFFFYINRAGNNPEGSVQETFRNCAVNISIKSEE